MRAAIVQTYGSPDTLQLLERPVPQPGPTELLVRVHASPVTQGDRRIRAGDFPGITAMIGRLVIGWSGPRAQVQGSMFAGVVESVGAAVTQFAPGDRVFGASMDGAHAELLVLDEGKAVAHIPDGVSFADAAAVPFGAGSALPFLRDLGEVTPGQRVLVIGAGGGVGRYAVQVARHLGAHVTGVCRRDQVDFVRSLGAQEVVVREDADWRTVDAVWDVIFDTAHAFPFADARPRLTADGRFLTLGLETWAAVWDVVRSSFGAGQKARWTVVMDGKENVQAVAGLLESGAIRAVVGPRFGLDQVAEAHRCLESKQAEGDVIIEVIPPAPRLAVAQG